MKTNSRNTEFPDFFADTKSPESVRRQFLETPLEGARQSAIGPALELAQLLTLLPDAFAASQRRELKRIQSSAKEYDPRVAALEASIEQADAMRLMARRGEVRAQRSLTAFATRDEVFHGFVSDSELNPLPGLTVQLTSGREKINKEFSATTDDDGYFSIPVGRKGSTKREGEKQAENLTPEQIAELLARRGKETSDYQQQWEGRTGIRVEILKKDKLLHEDPVPIGLGEGSAYREYFISDKKYSSRSDFDDFVSQQGVKPKSSPVDLKDGASRASKASVRAPTAASAPKSRQSAKKKSPKRAKTPKTVGKK